MERMRVSRVAAAIAAGWLIAWPRGEASAQTTPPATLAPPADATAGADAALALGIAGTRMTVPVTIAGRGPWPFVIDTGAERSVVSRQLAERLGLAAGPPLRVLAMTGQKVVASVLVPALAVSRVGATSVVAPRLEEEDIGAAGLLGIDTLQGHRVDLDFVKGSMSVQPSRRHPVSAETRGDEIVVVARSQFGQLIVTDARWRGRRIAVVIDTGSAMSVGNPALQRLLAKHGRPLGPVVAWSVTGASLEAQAFAVGDLSFGGVRINQLPIAFADAAPFGRFGLERRPAIMLGMDTLRLFRRVRIDFANRAIEFHLPPGVLDDGAPAA